MKHKTSELTGDLLNAAVAKVDGVDVAMSLGGYLALAESVKAHPYSARSYSPSSDWSQGGPIIEREGIELHCIDRNGRRMNEWMARHPARALPLVFARTPLIAAMCAYVASKLGDEVDL